MELNIEKPKKLVFNISIADVDISAIQGTLVIYFDKENHIGFKAKIVDGKVVVNIPSLLQFNFENGGRYKAELWIIANRDYFTIPWSNEILIKKPIDIKTEISIKESDDPYILVTKPVIRKE